MISGYNTIESVNGVMQQVPACCQKITNFGDLYDAGFSVILKEEGKWIFSINESAFEILFCPFCGTKLEQNNMMNFVAYGNI